MREIPLSRGLVALVDEADYDPVVAAGPWHAYPGPNTFYARHSYRQGGKVRHIPMHRFIAGWSYIDHVDGNGLNNGRHNLRPANETTNGMNRGMSSNNTSGFKGVTRDRLKWQARIHVSGRPVYLGIFLTPLEAARAYDAAAHLHYGEYARPNFPLEVTA